MCVGVTEQMKSVGMTQQMQYVGVAGWEKCEGVTGRMMLVCSAEWVMMVG